MSGVDLAQIVGAVSGAIFAIVIVAILKGVDTDF